MIGKATTVHDETWRGDPEVVDSALEKFRNAITKMKH